MKRETAFATYDSFPLALGPIIVADYSGEREIQEPSDEQLMMFEGEEEDA